MQSEAFRQERAARIKKNEEDRKLRHTAKDFLFESIRAGYSYNFDWLGRPIIQYPQDILAVQEIIWSVKPDLIITHSCGALWDGDPIVMDASETIEVCVLCSDQRDSCH